MGRPSTAESLKEYFSSGVNKKKWEEAKERAKQSTSYDYDDGTYNAQLVNIEVGRSKASNRLQVVMSFKFVEGEYKGKPVRKFSGIDDPEGNGVTFLLRDLKAFGYADVDIEEIEDEVFKKLNKEKPVVKIQLKTKEGSEYQNLFILGLVNGKVENDEEGEEDDDELDDNEADKPKDTSKETKDSDESDDEEGEEESEDEDSDDDEDEEKEEEEEKPKPKKSKLEDDNDEDEDETAEEKVTLEVGMRLKVQHNKEVSKAKIVKVDDEAGKVKVKFPDGEKAWIKAEEIIDIIES